MCGEILKYLRKCFHARCNKCVWRMSEIGRVSEEARKITMSCTQRSGWRYTRDEKNTWLVEYTVHMAKCITWLAYLMEVASPKKQPSPGHIS